MCKHLRLTHPSGLCISLTFRWNHLPGNERTTQRHKRQETRKTVLTRRITSPKNQSVSTVITERSECNLWVQKLVEWQMAFMIMRLYVHKKEALDANISSFWSRCSIVVSIPACHAGDPGSIPGSGEALFFCLVFVVLFRGYCYGEVTWNLELFWLTLSRLQVPVLFWAIFSFFLMNAVWYYRVEEQAIFINKSSSETQALPIERSKIMDKEIAILGNLFDKNELNNGR